MPSAHAMPTATASLRLWRQEIAGVAQECCSGGGVRSKVTGTSSTMRCVPPSLPTALGGTLPSYRPWCHPPPSPDLPWCALPPVPDFPPWDDTWQVSAIIRSSGDFFKEWRSSLPPVAVDDASARAEKRWQMLKGSNVTTALTIVKFMRQKAGAANVIAGANRKMLSARHARYLMLIIPLRRLLRRSVRAYRARRDERDAELQYNAIELAIHATTIQTAYRRYATPTCHLPRPLATCFHSPRPLATCLPSELLPMSTRGSYASALDAALTLADAQHRPAGMLAPLVSRIDLLHSPQALTWLTRAGSSALETRRTQIAAQLDSLVRARMMRARAELMRVTARKKHEVTCGRLAGFRRVEAELSGAISGGKITAYAPAMRLPSHPPILNLQPSPSTPSPSKAPPRHMSPTSLCSPRHERLRRYADNLSTELRRLHAKEERLSKAATDLANSESRTRTCQRALADRHTGRPHQPMSVNRHPCAYCYSHRGWSLACSSLLRGDARRDSARAPRQQRARCGRWDMDGPRNAADVPRRWSRRDVAAARDPPGGAQGAGERGGAADGIS